VAVVVGFGIRVAENAPFGDAIPLWIDRPGFGYHRDQGNPLSPLDKAIHGLPDQFHSASAFRFVDLLLEPRMGFILRCPLG
jgi:hypothetical protein